MSSITAALGISQLRKLETLISKRRKNSIYLSSKLKKCSEITLPLDYKNHKNVFQLYTIRIRGKILEII